MSVRKDLIWVLCLFLSISVNVIAGADILSRCRATGLPILHIETVDSVMPSCDLIIEPPTGCVGHGITNNEKVGARMWIEENGDTIYDSGIYEDKKSGLTIKVRGNTTASIDNAEKKPYKLKLQKKADLLFRGDDAKYADKEWVLLRQVICETIAGNITNRVLGMPWTPSEKVVLLILNGDFRGLYLLTENVKKNQKCRVNISQNGYLYEYDAYWWNEDYYILSNIYSPFLCNYTLKYPESKDILPWQEQYITECIRQIENAYVTIGAIDTVIDIPSYARWLWVHDVLGDWDSGGSNPFIAIYDTISTSKTFMTCAWDFGGCFTDRKKGQWGRQHTFWCYDYFFKLPQMSFVKEYIGMYERVVNGAFDIVANRLDSFSETPLIETIDKGQKLDNERWNITEPLPSKKFPLLADYLRNRKTEVDSLMTIVKKEYDWRGETIDVINADTASTREFYDILGRHIAEPTSGIVIIRYMDGKCAQMTNLFAQ